MSLLIATLDLPCLPMMMWIGAANASALIAAAAGIIGAAVGASVAGLISSKNSKHERRHRLLQQKLEEFYGPLLAIRSRIKAKSEIRLKIAQLAGDEWPKLAAEARVGGVEGLEQLQKDRWSEYEKIFKYEDKQLREQTLPSYREMVTLFISKMYLAEPATRNHLTELINFVEVWDRWADGSIPKEVLPRLDHSEKRLFPLYDDLEKQFAALQNALSTS